MATSAVYGLVVLVLVSSGPVTYYARVNSLRAALETQSDTVLSTVKAAIRAQGRRGQYQADHLTAIFEELVKNRGILAVGLSAQDGTMLAEAGDTALLSRRPDDRPVVGDTAFVSAAPLTLENAGGFGPHGLGFRGGQGAARQNPPEQALPSEPMTLTLAVDAAPMNLEVRRERWTSARTAGLLLFALGLVTYIRWMLVKRRRLERDLLLAQELAGFHERVAQMGAGLAHETKNPLGVVRGLAQAITESPDSQPEATRLAAAIVDEADRTVRQINSFLSLSRPRDPSKANVELDAFFRAFLPLLRAESASTHVAVDYTPCGLTILADEEQLRRVVLNLVINAMRASRTDGQVRCGAARHGRTVTVTVADDGCGIAADDLPHVTEPYFTRFDGGTGLGLTVVDQIVRAHGWSLRIDSNAGKGTVVSIEGVSPVG
ncbi:MAG: hypothetical protein HZB26_23000 [Candidatus Hydrogenedentes bacterium]|nr:hypothetical protein [Candidatus Hydrogenedentota bacterium]